MGELLTIIWPYYNKHLRDGVGRLFNDKIGCDIQIWLNEDSRFTRAHSFIFQIFCQIPQQSFTDGRHFRFEDEAMCKDDLRCLMEFLYSGKTYVEAKRLKVVKKAAEKMGLKVFVDILQDIINKRENNSNDADPSSVLEEKNLSGSAVDEHSYGTKKWVENQEPMNPVGLRFGTATAVSEENKTELKRQKLNENSEIENEEISNHFCDITEASEENEAELNQQQLKENSEIGNKDISKKSKNYSSVGAIPEENETEPNKQKLSNENGNKTASRKSKKFPIKKEFVCPVCDKVYRSKNRYVVHMKVHENADKVLQSCSYCSFEGLNLKGHLLRAHSRDKTGQILEKTLKCDECDFVSAAQSLLNRHKLMKHTTPSVKCDQCSNAYHWKGELTKHKRAIHPEGGKTFMCDICATCKKNAWSLKLHKARHSAVKVICDICGIQVVDYCLKKHQTGMHAQAHKRFKCGLCNAVCKQRMNLIFHFRNVHKVAESEIKETMKEKSMEITLDEAEKEGLLVKIKKPKAVPTVCPVCGITLSQKWALVRHMKLHGENGKPYKCSFCKFTARDQHHLKVHLENKHDKKNEEENDVVEMNSAVNIVF